MVQPTIQETIESARQHQRAGRLQHAEQLYRQVLTLQPDNFVAMHSLGVIAHQVGRLDIAADLIRRSIAVDPNNAEAHNSLGNVFLDQRRPDDAIAAYRQAIALRPDFAAAHCKLGVALREKGQFAGAISAQRQAIAIQPDFHEAFGNLGIALHDSGQFVEAVAAYRQAIALKPDSAETYYHLGISLQCQGRFDEAVAAYRQAVALRSFPEAQRNLAVALQLQGQLDEAIAAYRQVLAVNPGLCEIHSNLLYTLYFQPACDAQTIAREHREWNRRHAEPLTPKVITHVNDCNPDRRLRIGYVSPDFRNHPVGRFLLPLLANHDHRNIEVFAYSNVPARLVHPMTGRFRSHVDGWRDISNLSDAQAADLIRQDRVDILVDLSLHMAFNRLLVFARKPAPVQVTYLAYAGTSGLTTIDYRLSDPWLDPVGSDESVYSEQTIRLPETYWCYQPVADLPCLPPPSLEKGFVTFGCLNNFSKVNEPLLNIWARLLATVPRSTLVLHAREGSHRQRVLEHFQKQGVDPQRVRFVGMAPTEAYLKSYHSIDIVLDTTPYSGGTTTCDALWMGVPVVSLAGNTAVGRGGLSILSNIGLTELVGRSADEYVRIAAGLADDPARLSDLRSSLRRRMEESPLMDAPGFARNIEAEYRRMWRTWCESKAPAA